jgi:hypothetical protein
VRRREDLAAVLPPWCKEVRYDKSTHRIVLTVSRTGEPGGETVDLPMTAPDAERLADAIEWSRQAAVADTGHQARAAALTCARHRRRDRG